MRHAVRSCLPFVVMTSLCTTLLVVANRVVDVGHGCLPKVEIYASHTICPVKDGVCLKAGDNTAVGVGGAVAFYADSEPAGRISQREFVWTPQVEQLTSYETRFAVYFEAKTVNFNEPGHRS